MVVKLAKPKTTTSVPETNQSALEAIRYYNYKCTSGRMFSCSRRINRFVSTIYFVLPIPPVLLKLSLKVLKSTKPNLVLFSRRTRHQRQWDWIEFVSQILRQVVVLVPKTPFFQRKPFFNSQRVSFSMFKQFNRMEVTYTHNLLVHAVQRNLIKGP